jgi:hypothetical protein
MYRFIFLLVISVMSLVAMAQVRHASKGSMSFKFNGQAYAADPSHAKGYAMSQTGLGYINGANSTTGILIGLELFVKAKGEYVIKGDKDGKVNFTINGVMYWVRSSGNYLKIVIKETKQLGSLLLLNGTFEGIVEDKDGHKAQITEGKFSTEKL